MVCRRRRQPARRRLLSPTGCRGAAAGELFVRRWQGEQLPPYFWDSTQAELEAGRNRRTAAEALFEAMDEGHFDLDLAAIDRLNEPTPG